MWNAEKCKLVRKLWACGIWKKGICLVWMDYEVVGHELRGELRPDPKVFEYQVKEFELFITETPGRHQRLLNRWMTRWVPLKENSGSHM